MKLTKNFIRQEFDCRDGTPVPDSLLPNLQKLAENLQVLRDYIGKPIHINSGYRSPSHNKKIGGATQSQHLLATAADITVRDMTPSQVYRAIEKLIKSGQMHNGGLGLYKGFVHYDVRPSPARWKG